MEYADVKEERKFLSRWYEEEYLPTEGRMLEEWHELALQTGIQNEK